MAQDLRPGTSLPAHDLIRVWVQVASRGGTSAIPGVAELLEQCGVNAYPFDRASFPGPGVLVFEAVDPRLCDWMRSASRCGLERVLAIGTTPAALAKDGAWALMQAGASDVLHWEPGGEAPRGVADRLRHWNEVDCLARSAAVRGLLVGESPEWIKLLRRIVEVARFTDAPILLTGESGTGKELVARLVHSLSRRASERDLVLLDCTTIVPELSGSEFFGHERGAFTGAVTSRAGAFALADGSTLFLDEVGDLPLRLQAELLRVVQEHSFKPVGSNHWERTDFRLICATNRDLLALQAAGRFRGDLYHRIACWTFRLPPLRDRPDDILPLVREFLRRLRPHEETVCLDDLVRSYVQGREYPGNIRDLKHLVARISDRHVGPGPITIGDVPEDERPAVPSTDRPDEHFERPVRCALEQGTGLKDIGRKAEDVAVRIAIAASNGSLQRAATILGITDRALQMRKAAGRLAGNTGGVGPASSR